jgi:hypothetical protein
MAAESHPCYAQKSGTLLRCPGWNDRTIADLLCLTDTKAQRTRRFTLRSSKPAATLELADT